MGGHGRGPPDFVTDSPGGTPAPAPPAGRAALMPAGRAALMVVPARPARMPAASASAPIAAGWPDAVTKRMHASTLGPIDPAGNVMADSATVSIASMGCAPGVP